MRKVAALGLLLVQLQPFVGAGICLHATVQQEECSMPANEPAPDTEQSERTPPPECSQMAICAPASPVIPQTVLRLLSPALPGYVAYSSPALFLPGDTIAPPQPPPIA